MKTSEAQLRAVKAYSKKRRQILFSLEPEVVEDLIEKKKEFGLTWDQFFKKVCKDL